MLRRSEWGWKSQTHASIRESQGRCHGNRHARRVDIHRRPLLATWPLWADTVQLLLVVFRPRVARRVPAKRKRLTMKSLGEFGSIALRVAAVLLWVTSTGR